MYRYMICSEPDKELFKKQCTALEKHIPHIVKGRLLHDVDDSQTQIYRIENAEILVHNSYYENELFVESEIRLEPFFK